MITKNTFTLKEASEWVSKNFNRKVTPANISYLVQYGQIRKIYDIDETRVYLKDLHDYFSKQGNREITWKNILGENLDWHLSFENVKETRNETCSSPTSL